VAAAGLLRQLRLIVKHFASRRLGEQVQQVARGETNGVNPKAVAETEDGNTTSPKSATVTLDAPRPECDLVVLEPAWVIGTLAPVRGPR
jgi:hypothetical protein